LKKNIDRRRAESLRLQHVQQKEPSKSDNFFILRIDYLFFQQSKSPVLESALFHKSSEAAVFFVVAFSLFDVPQATICFKSQRCTNRMRALTLFSVSLPHALLLLLLYFGLILHNRPAAMS
jgi:hypothetical protein